MYRTLPLLGLALLLTTSCAPGSGSNSASNSNSSAGGNQKFNGPQAPTGTAKGNVEVVAFKGGYGIDFYQTAATEFNKAHPGAHVTVTGDPHVWEQLRPRMVAGTPPDLMYPGWGMDHWKLAEEGQVMKLDDALNSPAYDGKGTWKDTFEPSILKLGQKDGKQFVLPYFFNLQGMWFDPGVFKDHGWTLPQTWSQFLALCAKIKAAGIAPLTFQGKYPYYMLENMVIPWVQDIAGIQAVNDMQNLEKGAWENPAVLQAVTMIDTLNKDGYFLRGSVGMTHTESQTEFLEGKAAMIPCGSWLYSEMKATMPAGAQMQYFLPPFPDGGKGDPSAIMISIEPWMIPTKAKNPAGGIEFFKYLTSLPKAKEFVQQKATLMAIKGSDQVQLPQTLVEPAKLFHQSKTIYSYMARQWYPSMETDIENALTSMLNGEITPQQFCDKAEASAEKTMADTSITKHHVN